MEFTVQDPESAIVNSIGLVCFTFHALLPGTYRKIAGIEMEALGVATACQGRCDFVVVKSISDWADEKEGDSQHSYCTKVSADLVVSMIEDETI